MSYVLFDSKVCAVRLVVPFVLIFKICLHDFVAIIKEENTFCSLLWVTGLGNLFVALLVSA